jgi:D-sedoheptulose 7-phosphate isomerase
MKNLILKEIEFSIEVKKQVLANSEIIEKVERLVENCLIVLKSGGKIIFCGNGGSFSDSQHLAAEFVSRLRFDRAPLASIALGTNSSNMSAIGNDYGFESIFSRELLAVAGKNDIFIPISTSGNSPNVVKAIDSAKELGIKICGLTGGTGGLMKDLCDTIIVPDSRTEKIQEVHIMLGHIICYLIEEKIFK